MEKLKKGELDAVIVVGGKPYLSVSTFKNDGRFHLAGVDYSKPLQRDYLPATLTSDDYPNLIPEGDTVDTIAVPAVLAAYNWPADTERNRRLALFVDAFFNKFPTLQNPPFHPKWMELSLVAPLAGWNRLPLAQQWLDKHGIEPLKQQRFEAYLQDNPAAANVQSEADKESLFEKFHAWDVTRNARAEVSPQAEKTREPEDNSSHAVRHKISKRHALRKAFARMPVSKLQEHDAQPACGQNSYRNFDGPDACQHRNEDTWWKPFSGLSQGASTAGSPSSGFFERQSN
jgi:hypothetical protein